MTKKNLKNKTKKEEELDSIESDEDFLDWLDDDGESDDGTIHAHQFYTEEEETELTGELSERQRERPDKDAEADLVWDLYWKHNNFQKVADELGLPLTTVQNKFYSAFRRKTGFPSDIVNLKRYRRARQQEIENLLTILSCADCPHLRPRCSEKCEKLRELLPDFTEPQGLSLDPAEVSDMFDSTPSQPKRPLKPYDQEDEDETDWLID